MYRRRNTNRLVGHDYSQPGECFVTLSAKDREHLFGQIKNGMMQFTQAGEIAVACWKEIPLHFTNIELDEFIVMPDHIHGILSIIETLRRDVQLNIPTEDYFSRISPKRGSLAVVVRTYKAAVTTICRQNGIGEFAWQRGYYDHIIRDTDSLARIRAYIVRNSQNREMNK